MAKVLVSNGCFCVSIEKILGNPDMKNHHIPLPCSECSICKNEKLFPQINKEGMKTVILDLFIFGENSIQEKPNLKNMVKAIKSYPNIQKLLLSGSRSHTGIEPVEIKIVIFMLVAHGFLKLRFDEETNGVVFSLAKLFHNESILALQYDAYWEAMNTLVDFRK